MGNRLLEFVCRFSSEARADAVGERPRRDLGNRLQLATPFVEARQHHAPEPQRPEALVDFLEADEFAGQGFTEKDGLAPRDAAVSETRRTSM